MTDAIGPDAVKALFQEQQGYVSPHTQASHPPHGSNHIVGFRVWAIPAWVGG